MNNKVLMFFSLVFMCKSVLVFGQTVPESVQIADSMFMKKEYENSIKIYKRALYFSEAKVEIYKKVADTYYMQENYQEACIYYDSAIIEHPVKDYNELIFSKTDCYIFLEQYDSAFQSVMQLKPEKSDFFVQQINFYKGIICFSDERYEEAEVYFLNTLPDSAIHSKEKIKALFEKKRKFRSPKPGVAGIMSLIVPGTGQFYTGQYKSGINSIVLLGIISIIAVDLGIRFSFYDPLITILPWFFRYYKGGYRNSKEFAHEKLNQNRTQTLNEILEIIQAANE
jgi:tetratricopeptide (TPR) repeat protein